VVPPLLAYKKLTLLLSTIFSWTGVSYNEETKPSQLTISNMLCSVEKLRSPFIKRDVLVLTNH